MRLILLLLVMLVQGSAFGAVGFGAQPGSGGGGSGAPVGTVVNTGASVAGQVPYNTDANATNVSSMFLLSANGLPLIGGATNVNATISNAGTGDIDVYTVPAGKRASVLSVTLFNQSGSTITFYQEVKIGGVYYPISTPANRTLISASVLNIQRHFLDTGDSFSINTTGTGLNIIATILEFPNTVGLKTVRLNTLTTGTNLIYVCPANKVATLIDPTSSANFDSGVYAVLNNSGGTRSYQFHVVPSGGTPSLNNIYGTNNVAANATNVTGNLTANGQLYAGDFVDITVDDGTATQYVWLSIFER